MHRFCRETALFDHTHVFLIRLWFMHAHMRVCIRTFMSARILHGVHTFSCICCVWAVNYIDECIYSLCKRLNEPIECYAFYAFYAFYAWWLYFPCTRKTTWSNIMERSTQKLYKYMHKDTDCLFNYTTYVHTNTHIHTFNTRTQTHTPVRAETCIHTCTYTNTCTHIIYSHTQHTHTLYAYTYTYIQASIHSVQMNYCIYEFHFTRIHIQTHIHTHANTNAYTPTLTRTLGKQLPCTIVLHHRYQLLNRHIHIYIHIRVRIHAGGSGACVPRSALAWAAGSLSSKPGTNFDSSYNNTRRKRESAYYFSS
jgi:hypothetical protein